MAEVKNGDEALLSSKRSPDLSTEDHLNGPKKQKVEDNNNGGEAPEAIKVSTEDKLVQKSKDKAAKAEEEEEREEKEEEQEGEDHSNVEAVIDRKGKGILIEEDDEEDDDDEDDLDSGLDSDSDIGENLSDDSDFDDDPLAEVELDNILPSRTRRKSIQPGVYIANDLPDEDSDESDDPDA